MWLCVFWVSCQLFGLEVTWSLNRKYKYMTWLEGETEIWINNIHENATGEMLDIISWYTLIILVSLEKAQINRLKIFSIFRFFFKKNLYSTLLVINYVKRSTLKHYFFILFYFFLPWYDSAKQLERRILVAYFAVIFPSR